MAYDWKDEIIESHEGGITDLITSSSPEFQELSINLAINKKIKALSTREGYLHWMPLQVTPPDDPTLLPSKIRQLMKLEDWIICYVYPDGSPVVGEAWARKETDTALLWTKVKTPKKRDIGVRFNISDANGHGINITIDNPDQLDSFIVQAGTSGATPSVSIDLIAKAIKIVVDTTKLNSLFQYDMGGSVLMTWFDFQPILQGSISGSTVSLFPNTTFADVVEFTGQLSVAPAIEIGYRGLAGGTARSVGVGDDLPIFDEAGHIQWPEWAGHLYLAHEPFDKSFTPNPDDIYAQDPDTYPPDNQRLPLRRLAAFATEPGVDPHGYELGVVNAQLPKTFIGVDEGSTTAGEYVPTYPYMRLEVSEPWGGTKHGTGALAPFTIWSERSWGKVGASGAMGAGPFFKIGYVNAVDRDGLNNVFTLVDFNDSGFGSYGAIAWGELALVYHSTTAHPISMKYRDMIAAIEDAFRRYNANARSAYRTFGWFVKPDPKTMMSFADDSVIVSKSPAPGYVSFAANYNASLPNDVTGNFQYGYAFFLREQYFAEFEDAPREFIFDGPTSFIQIRTLQKIGAPDVVAYTTSAKLTSATFSTTIPVWGGIAARMRRDTDLYNESNISAIFARTAAQGEVYYFDQVTRVWYRTEDAIAQGFVPASLLANDWDVKTGYVVNGQSVLTDEELVFNEEAYFNGGVLSYDSLPQGPFYFTICNQIGYHANIVNNIQRVTQSAPGVVHSSPLTLFVDVDDAITGMSAYLDRPLAFTAVKTWRLEGVRTADGQGRIVLRTVSDEFGCISNQSIVVTNVGVFYWSQAGIIFSNGLEAFRVTEHLIERYAGWVNDLRSFPAEIGMQQLRGTFDEQTRLIYWSCWDKNKKPFQVVLSLQGQVGPMMPLRIYEGVRRNNWGGALDAPSIPEDFFHTHACLYSDDTRRFFRSQENHLLYNDFNQTYDESHADGLKHPIVSLFKSIAFSYGVPWARKVTTRMFLNFRDMNHKGVSITPLGWNDLTVIPQYLANCLNFQHMEWQSDYSLPDNGSGPAADNLDLEHFFRQEDCQWKSDHVVAYKRRFPRGGIRNIYKQVGFKSLLYQYYPVIKLGTPTVIDISVSYTIATDLLEQWVTVDILVDDPLSPDNPFNHLSIDTSGQFYVSWQEDQIPLQIQRFETDAGGLGTLYRCFVLDTAGDMQTNVHPQFIYKWNEIKFYRYFTDQHLDLLGYSLTYRIIGSRTHGFNKSVQLGGNDA